MVGPRWKTEELYPYIFSNRGQGPRGLVGDVRREVPSATSQSSRDVDCPNDDQTIKSSPGT